MFLNIDISLEILEYLSIIDIYTLLKTSKFFYIIINDSGIINKKIKQRLKNDDLFDLIDTQKIFLSGSYLLSIITNEIFTIGCYCNCCECEYYEQDISQDDFSSTHEKLSSMGYVCDENIDFSYNIFKRSIFNVFNYHKKDKDKIQIICIKSHIPIGHFIYYNFDFDFLRSFYHNNELHISNISNKSCIISKNRCNI